MFVESLKKGFEVVSGSLPLFFEAFLFFLYGWPIAYFQRYL